jgi:hypothetical protein
MESTRIELDLDELKAILDEATGLEFEPKSTPGLTQADVDRGGNYRLYCAPTWAEALCVTPTPEWPELVSKTLAALRSRGLFAAISAESPSIIKVSGDPLHSALPGTRAAGALVDMLYPSEPPSAPMPKQPLTVEEAARIIQRQNGTGNVSPQRVRTLIRAGRLAATREETPRGPIWWLDADEVALFKPQRPGRPSKASAEG